KTALTSRVAETTSSGCRRPLSPAVPQQVVPIGTSTSSAKCVAICLSVLANSKCVMEQVGCTAIRPSFRRIVNFGSRSRHHAIESMMVRLSYLALVSASSSEAISWLRPRVHREDDATRPTGAYGRSKLVGEKRVAERCPNSAILRTAWVYSPFGANFVCTMLRLGETREEVGVVADQRGNPTSALD